MTGADGGVEADVDLAARGEMLLDERGGGVGDGKQSLHQQGGHAGDEDHDGTHRDRDVEEGLGGGAIGVGGGQKAVACEDSDDQADDGPQHDGVAKNAKLLLEPAHVYVDVLDDRDAVEDPVDGEGDGRVGTREAVGDRDAGKAEGLLDERGGEVPDDENDDLVDDGGGDAQAHVVGHDGDEGAREGEVPVVPDVDVGGLRGVGEQHEHVHQKPQRDDDRPDDGAHGDGRGCGPSHVHHGQRQTEALDHSRDGGGKVGAHELVDDQIQANEADADGEAGLEALAKARAKADPDDGQHDGHDHGDAQAGQPVEEANDNVH